MKESKIKSWIEDMETAKDLYKNSDMKISQIGRFLRRSPGTVDAMLTGKNLPKSIKARLESSMKIERMTEDGLLVYHISGNKDYEDTKKEWKEIYETVMAGGHRGVLVIDNSISHISPSNVISIVDWFSQVGLPRIKVALVDKNRTTQIEFAETACVNRGWNTIKFFTDETRARAWLENGNGERG